MRWTITSGATDSVLGQTHDDVELVITVDGTPKMNDWLVEDYGDREDPTVSCDEENLGLLASRNRGPGPVTGDVVAFIDDDVVADGA